MPPRRGPPQASRHRGRRAARWGLSPRPCPPRARSPRRRARGPGLGLRWRVGTRACERPAGRGRARDLGSGPAPPPPPPPGTRAPGAAPASPPGPGRAVPPAAAATLTPPARGPAHLALRRSSSSNSWAEPTATTSAAPAAMLKPPDRSNRAPDADGGGADGGCAGKPRPGPALPQVCAGAIKDRAAGGGASGRAPPLSLGGPGSPGAAAAAGAPGPVPSLRLPPQLGEGVRVVGV